MFESWEVLPYALYLAAIVSGLRAFQAYVPSLQNRLMRVLYSKASFSETSALAAREFGSWHLLNMVVQINAGIDPYHIGAYNVVLWAFAIQLLHFLFERVACGTVGGRDRGLLAAEIMAFVGFVWMMVQRDSYADAGGNVYNPNALWHPFEGKGYVPGPR